MNNAATSFEHCTAAIYMILAYNVHLSLSKTDYDIPAIAFSDVEDDKGLYKQLEELQKNNFKNTNGITSQQVWLLIKKNMIDPIMNSKPNWLKYITPEVIEAAKATLFDYSKKNGNECVFVPTASSATREAILKVVVDPTKFTRLNFYIEKDGDSVDFMEQINQVDFVARDVPLTFREACTNSFISLISSMIVATTIEEIEKFEDECIESLDEMIEDLIPEDLSSSFDSEEIILENGDVVFGFKASTFKVMCMEKESIEIKIEGQKTKEPDLQTTQKDAVAYTDAPNTATREPTSNENAGQNQQNTAPRTNAPNHHAREQPRQRRGNYNRGSYTQQNTGTTGFCVLL